MKILHIILSLILIATFSILSAADECSSDFSAVVNSSQNYNQTNVNMQNGNDTDAYYVNVSEAGSVTITITSSDNVFATYSENSCPSNSGGSITISKTFSSATDFNLLLYTNNSNHISYDMDIVFISAGNTAPVANSKSYITDFATALSGNIITDQTADTDINGDTLSISNFSSPTSGTLSVIENGGDGSFTFTPDANFSGVTQFDYSISDGTDVSNTETIYITVGTTSSTSGAPTYDSEYSCGIFPSVLASYQSITAQINDVYDTCKISVKDNALVEDDLTCWTGLPGLSSTVECECDPTVSVCSTNETCEIIPEPTNRYSHTFIDTTLSGTIAHSGDITFTDLYYPSYSISKQGNNKSVTFDPQYSYSGSSKKVMIMGDVSLTSNGQVLTLEEGDYYFNSLTLENTPDININGEVRIFIKNDFTYSGNSMNVVNEGSLFLYVGGDMAFTSNGGGNGYIDMFVYVVGTATVNANANAASLFGGITSESGINITGNNINFIYNEAGAEDLGYGECKLCYALKDSGSFINIDDLLTHTFTDPRDTAIVNTGSTTLKDLNITQSETTYGLSYDSDDFSVVDQSGSDQSKDVSVVCDGTNLSGFCNGTNTVMAEYGDYIIGDYNTFDAIRASNIYTPMNGITDFLVMANFNNGDDKAYSVELNYCDTTSGSSSEPVIGDFDAWDNGASDRNITTKVANQSFVLRIASLDENRDAAIKTDIDAQYMLYDYNTSQAITSWFDFDSSIHSTIVKTFTLQNAYRDVRVRFKFCQSETNATLAPYALCQNGTLGYDFNDTIASVDNFAIRPDTFTLNVPSGEDAELMTSAKDYNLSLIAQKASNTGATNLYSVNSIENIFSTSLIKYYPNGTDGTANLNGELSLNTNNTYDILNGTATNGLGIKFDDVGNVKIQVKDITWSSVDINNDSTSVDCSANGAYICGEIDLRYIPSSFTLSNASLYNEDALTFTYISNDFNLSSSLDLTITAKNALGGTTENFSAGLYENPVNVALSMSPITGMTPIFNDIDLSNNLSFSNGEKIITYSETNTSLNLLLNFTRFVNAELNPFILNGSDVTSSASSLYTNSSNTASKSIVGTIIADKNATFVYGRTNASRQIVEGSTGNASIYYEIFCSGTDSRSVACNKSLLPNGFDSKFGDDPRWFRNSSHSAVSFGEIGTVSEKGTSAATNVGSVNNATNGVSIVPITYSGTNYPYKTTMETNSSSWLIYNKHDINALTNEFEIEFIKTNTSWAGQHETNNSTEINAVDKTNRRTMW